MITSARGLSTNNGMGWRAGAGGWAPLVVSVMATAGAVGCSKLRDPYETVKLTELQTEYRASASAADRKYKDKKIRISGVVVSTLDHEESKWIFVNNVPEEQLGGDIFDRRHVICMVKSPAQMVHGVKGATITVHGVNAGAHPISNNFQFQDCVVEGKSDTSDAEDRPSKAVDPKPGPKPPPGGTLDIVFAGTYSSAWGPVTLSQKRSTPSKVTGIYGRGSMDCNVIAATLSCGWHERSTTGRAMFVRQASGDLTGTWGTGQSSTGGGAWNLKLTQRGTMQ